MKITDLPRSLQSHFWNPKEKINGRVVYRIQFLQRGEKGKLRYLVLKGIKEGMFIFRNESYGPYVIAPEHLLTVAEVSVQKLALMAQKAEG